jgi:hypothetical protein
MTRSSREMEMRIAVPKNEKSAIERKVDEQEQDLTMGIVNLI